MKYAILAAFCASSVSAACADPAIVALKTYTKEGCADADQKKDDAQLKTDKLVMDTMNTMVKGMLKCGKTSDMGAGIKSFKSDDCAGDGITILGYSDDACATEADLTDDMKKKSKMIVWGECKKVDPKVGDTDYW